MLFALHRWVAPPRASREIVVPADALAGLREDFRRRTGRMASTTDEQAMLEAYVDDEVLVREALALGLDRGDVIVRRRLIQKMEFLLESTEPIAPPSDAELERHLAAHRERYASPARVSLTHVFVSSTRAGARAEAEAGELRARLEAGTDPATLGDPFLRGREFRLHAEGELAAIFGAPFAAEAMRLGEGGWSAPIRSSFGWHLVRVSEKRPRTEPVLADVRAQVERDWRAERRAALDRDARARLRGRYVVRVEGSPS
jgi:hypothetical protein